MWRGGAGPAAKRPLLMVSSSSSGALMILILIAGRGLSQPSSSHLILRGEKPAIMLAGRRTPIIKNDYGSSGGSTPSWAAETARHLASSAVPCSALAVPVVIATDATADEHEAAAELALWAGKVAHGPSLRILSPGELKPNAAHFAVGTVAAATAGVGISTSKLVGLGAEGFIVRGRWGGVIGLSGAANSTRGSLFAALQVVHMLGVRFFTANVTGVPACSAKRSDALPAINLTFIPTFEYRSVDGWAAELDPLHTLRHHLTDMHRDGRYATPPGIVHTSYNFFSGPRQGRGPSYPTFQAHPEWFYPHNDSSVYGQLCWNNQSMIDTIIGSVRTFLAEQPNATLISVSQK